MAIAANSYGSSGEVAALAPRYASHGVFDITTRPTLAQVENLIDQVSAVMNTALAQDGFAIPMAQADARLMLALFVTEEVAAIVEGINGSGRFGPTTKGPGRSRFAIVLDDVQGFLAANATGLGRLGAERTATPAGGIGYRDSDASGRETFPLFQRRAFGDDAYQEDWDR